MPYVDLADFRAHCEEYGDSSSTTCLLFVHGYTESARVWHETVRRLPPRYRMVLADLRGAGSSGQPSGGYTIEQYARDIDDLASALQLPPFVYIGHSMGGLTGLYYAIHYGSRLRGLVTVDPAPADGLPPFPEEFLAQMRAERMNRELRRERLRTMALVRPISTLLVDMLIDDSWRVSDGHYNDSLRSMQEIRIGDDLARIDVPALMVAGDRDITVPVETMLATWRRIPNCRLQVFQNVGHTPPLEVPEDLAKVLAEFVDGIGAPAPASLDSGSTADRVRAGDARPG